MLILVSALVPDLIIKCWDTMSLSIKIGTQEGKISVYSKISRKKHAQVRSQPQSTSNFDLRNIKVVNLENFSSNNFNQTIL